jgi:L-ascorbate metabolism protein UlaG (beta-lactamase superfamily)
VTLLEPKLSGAALAADIEAANPGDGIALWWLGQSGFLVKSAAGRVLFDPYLSGSLTRKYANTDKPHVRMTALAIEPGKLRGIDVVTSSHNHTDHLDAETLQPIFAANPAAAFIIPAANRQFVADRVGCDPNWPVGLSDGESRTVGACDFHAVPAVHNEIDRDEHGRCRYVGYVARIGNVMVYHSGDTLRYANMAELLRPFAIDVALLPINGDRPQRRVAGNMFGDEAAQLAHDIGARLVIPCHYNMFAFNTEPPDLFVESCERLGQPYRVLECGERFEYRPTHSTDPQP